MPFKTLKTLICATSLACASLLPMAAHAETKQQFNLAWTIYAGWMPWKYADESGIMKKWADKYGIEVKITQINDYVESINQFTAGQFDAVVLTSMDALSIPAAGGVDSTALIVGDYSNGNDGMVMKDSADLKTLKGQKVNLVELSVSHYLLAHALDSVGLSERDVEVVNTSDADIVGAFASKDVRNVVTWNPLLDEVAATPGSHRVFDSSQIPGHIKDLTLTNTRTLADNPAFGKAVVGAWYEVMGIIASDTEEGAKARAFLGKASGTDQAGYESQLKGMKMFWTPKDSLVFIESPEALSAMDSVRQFSFAHGLLGENAANADFIGIAMPKGKLLGDADNVKLRFDTTYMQMANDGKL
ncbi:ABC transporter substrate-binding protein [Pseudomonas straminea]|uniref:NitT/TauT family transport system substrate-binding protein n=1 Tax=Pseudomonas straminea TaxID=47882 RepID=A0A1I1S471_PSEOC|nr:putative urea ABC transporter substrate-binding protein [Pseudomonas straminea]GLX11882.1 ABC transporter substrate-binding protein [Pseudomonas straminea]SFD41394.1 NitT/TauT family transport system substrate-binding protein [Pseudomonas straminea]